MVVDFLIMSSANFATTHGGAQRSILVLGRGHSTAQPEREGIDGVAGRSDAQAADRCPELLNDSVNARGVFNRRAGSRQGQLALLGMQDENTPRRPI